MDPEAIDGFFPEPVKHSLKQTVNISGLHETDALKAILGSAEFTTTKGKQVKGNERGKTAYTKVRKYRQVLKQKRNYSIPLTRQELEAQQKQRQQM